MRRALLVPALLLAATLAEAGTAPRKIERKQRAIHAKVVTELSKLAKSCASNKAYGEARAEYRKALRLDPTASKPARELVKLEGKQGQPSRTILDSLARKRTQTYVRCGALLHELAEFCENNGWPDGYETAATSLAIHFPGTVELDVVWFEPYLRYIRPGDKVRLEAGGERVDCQWLERVAVADLNREHSVWERPWVLSDGVHEVRTTMPLRTARSILAHVTAFRAHFLAEFAGAWDLRTPSGTLPVIVTATQAELRARARAHTGGDRGPGTSGAAYYLWSNRPLNPCFVTFEPMTVDGTASRIEFPNVIRTLYHELTHQIAYEYNKHGANASRRVEHHFWAVEGLANFMENYAIDDSGWRLAHVAKVYEGDAYSVGTFAWCAENAASIPHLSRFFAIEKARFATIPNYNISGTLTYFLLQGEGGRYRAALMKVLDAVHKLNERPDTFDKAFKGVGVDRLDGEWKRFVAALEIEED